MNESSGLQVLNTGRHKPLRRAAGAVVVTIFVALVTSRTTKANGQQFNVVARVDAKSTGLISGGVVVRIGNQLHQVFRSCRRRCTTKRRDRPTFASMLCTTRCTEKT
jgi:hypothetical protein